MFSLTKRETIASSDPDKAVFFYASGGIGFGCASLGMNSDPLDKVNGCYCHTNEKGDYSHYNVPNDSEGNNLYTGEGKGMSDDEKTFSLTVLESYSIDYQ